MRIAQFIKDDLSRMLDLEYSNASVVDMVAEKDIFYINRLIIESTYAAWVLKTRTRLLEDEVRKRAETLEKALQKTKAGQTPDVTVNDL